MRKVASIFFAMLFLANSASAAEMVAGIGYSSIDDEVTLGALVGTIGYRYQTDYSTFSVTPELRIGIGINDDSIAGVDVELDKLYGISVRGEWDFGDTYAFVVPSYTNVGFEVSFLGFSFSEDDWEFGVGAGAGFRLQENMDVEISYEVVDESDIFTVGIRFDF